MKKSPAILFLLPLLLLLLLTGISLKAGATDRATTDYLPFGTRWAMTGGTQARFSYPRR